MVGEAGRNPGGNIRRLEMGVGVPLQVPTSVISISLIRVICICTAHYFMDNSVLVSRSTIERILLQEENHAYCTIDCSTAAQGGRQMYCMCYNPLHAVSTGSRGDGLI